jgi:hypothetical protein
MLSVYQGKVNKNVPLLSSLHTNANIANTEKKNPETVPFYNSTKFGVNVLDQTETVFCNVSFIKVASPGFLQHSRYSSYQCMDVAERS